LTQLTEEFGKQYLNTLTEKSREIIERHLEVYQEFIIFSHRLAPVEDGTESGEQSANYKR
jgi:hypothetical protein